LVAENRRALGLTDLVALAADGRALPYRPGGFDGVLVDAPCSGLGALRRRPDARWRVTADAVERLAELQFDLVHHAIAATRPGGDLVYSVCTLTAAESSGIDARLAAAHPELEPVDDFPAPWVRNGRGARLLPQTIGSDGMCAYRYRIGTGR
jgi:16S rRNA (cytosine967-C5)-methyltransferase